MRDDEGSIILHNGVSRTFRDARETAFEAARYAKSKSKGEIIEITARPRLGRPSRGYWRMHLHAAAKSGEVRTHETLCGGWMPKRPPRVGVEQASTGPQVVASSIA
jgi:hypothetical protein